MTNASSVLPGKLFLRVPRLQREADVCLIVLTQTVEGKTGANSARISVRQSGRTCCISSSQVITCQTALETSRQEAEECSIFIFYTFLLVLAVVFL